MRRLAERLRPGVLRYRRGWNTAYGGNPLVLVMLAVTSIARGQNYLNNGIPPGSLRPVNFLSTVVDPAAWSTLYVISGVLLLLGLVWRGVFALGAGACTMLWMFWGLAFLFSAFDGDGAMSSGAYVTGLTFFTYSLAVMTLAVEEVKFDDRHRQFQGGAA